MGGERETKWVRLEKRESERNERTRDGEKEPNSQSGREKQREMKRAGVLFIHLPLH